MLLLKDSSGSWRFATALDLAHQVVHGDGANGRSSVHYCKCPLSVQNVLLVFAVPVWHFHNQSFLCSGVDTPGRLQPGFRLLHPKINAPDIGYDNNQSEHQNSSRHSFSSFSFLSRTRYNPHPNVKRMDNKPPIR